MKLDELNKIVTSRKALRSFSTDVCEFIQCWIEDNAEEDDSESIINLQLFSNLLELQMNKLLDLIFG